MKLSRATCSRYSTRARPSALLALALAVSTGATACDGSYDSFDRDDEKPGASQSDTVGISDNPLFLGAGAALWPAGRVPVCFVRSTDSTNVPDALRTRVRQLIGNSWGRVANIQFWNWRDCPATLAQGDLSSA